jgi:hypothetical protein
MVFGIRIAICIKKNRNSFMGYEWIFSELFYCGLLELGMRVCNPEHGSSLVLQRYTLVDQG